MTTEKKTPDWLSKALELVTSLRGLVVLALTAFGVGGGSGFVLADAGVTLAESTAIADSTSRAQVKAATDSLGGEISKLKAESRAMVGGLMDALPAFKAAMESRGQANADAQRKQAETDRIMDNLIGSTP